MMNFIKKKLKEEKGLTLIELLAVIVILGIIAAIAIPAIGNIIGNSQVNALKADGQNVLAAANIYFSENAGDSSADETDLAGYLEDEGGMDPGYVVTKAPGGNTLDGSATNGDITVTFNDATNADINAAGTSADETYTNVVIER